MEGQVLDYIEEVMDQLRDQIHLNWWQKLQLKILGYAYIGKWPYPGTGKMTEWYAFYCEKHGMQVNYPAGYKEKFSCGRCLKNGDE